MDQCNSRIIRTCKLLHTLDLDSQIRVILIIEQTVDHFYSIGHILSGHL